MQIEREPEECVSAIVETLERVHDDGTVTRFAVRFRRADGQHEPPICVASVDRAIELVLEMNPEIIYLRVADGEEHDALLNAFGDERAQRRTLH